MRVLGNINTCFGWPDFIYRCLSNDYRSV